jgi:hypothetical protein
VGENGLVGDKGDSLWESKKTPRGKEGTRREKERREETRERKRQEQEKEEKDT